MPTIESSLQICSPRLPLAVYREVKAHLRQVEGVEVELLPQTSLQFDYLQSQVGGIDLRYTEAATAQSVERVGQILAYYGDRYGSWQAIDSVCSK